jgi:uncharacterized protein YegP (UPF0339 family)
LEVDVAFVTPILDTGRQLRRVPPVAAGGGAVRRRGPESGSRMKLVIVPSGGQYYFRILAANNRTLANSERYHNRADCQNAINLIKAGAAGAPVERQS